MTEDRCRPHGIPFDRDEVPLDDEDLEDIAWIAGEFDSAFAAIRSHVFQCELW